VIPEKTPRHPGFFVTVEGVDGVGKSTQVDLLCAWLEAQGIAFVCTREPGGTSLGEAIRELLLCPSGPPVADLAELLLIFAARAQHLEQVIKPALTAGKVVLCDRFTDASFAYQGAGRGLSQTALCTLESLVQAGLQPDLTFLLDMPVTDGLARLAKTGDPDRLEQLPSDFFARVRQMYLTRAREYPERFVMVDACHQVNAVRDQLVGILRGRLGRE